MTRPQHARNIEAAVADIKPEAYILSHGITKISAEIFNDLPL
jgi:hypothetical protein